MFKFSLLEDYPLLQVITTADDGNVDARFSPNSLVRHNLKKICKQCKIASRSLVQMEQVHKTKVSFVDAKDKGKIIKDTDALITNDPQVVLMLRIADCIPIYLFDPHTRSIALIHSGWRGSLGKILPVAIESLMLKFSANPENMLLALGPSLQVCCNKYKDSPLQAQLPEWQPFIHLDKEEYAVDVPGFVIESALQAGISKKNIEACETCTAMDRKFYSHRRIQAENQAEARFAALFGLSNTKLGKSQDANET